MQLSLPFIRFLFVLITTLLSTAYAATQTSLEQPAIAALAGACCGLLLGLAVVSLDTVFKRLNLRAFNVTTLGLFFGYLMGTAVLNVLDPLFEASGIALPAAAFHVIRPAIFLITCYLGMVMTARAADELYMSVPFIKFKSSSQNKKDLILDVSALSDPRMIDLAATGLLDQLVVVPRFIVKELQDAAESNDEGIRSKARKSLETLKKLEMLSSLDLRYTETASPDSKDASARMNRLARLLDANILTGDASKTQQPVVDGIRIINIHALSQALKPVAQMGELLTIKIQRYGKEPRQGVGYLEDGTMVVVNGGAEFIGETIRGQVLSVKHTASGRMIFCNAVDETSAADAAYASPDGETAPSPYFAR